MHAGFYCTSLVFFYSPMVFQCKTAHHSFSYKHACALATPYCTMLNTSSTETTCLILHPLKEPNRSLLLIRRFVNNFLCHVCTPISFYCTSLQAMDQNIFSNFWCKSVSLHIFKSCFFFKRAHQNDEGKLCSDHVLHVQTLDVN